MMVDEDHVPLAASTGNHRLITASSPMDRFFCCRTGGNGRVLTAGFHRCGVGSLWPSHPKLFDGPPSSRWGVRFCGPLMAERPCSQPSGRVEPELISKRAGCNALSALLLLDGAVLPDRRFDRDRPG